MDDDFDTGAPRSTEDRPRGVPKAKLSDIDLEPKLSVFYRPHRHAAMAPLDSSFPREAAKIFCDRIRSDIEDNNSRSYVITGGEQVAYKMIFTWINDCVQTQSIEKFPEIPEPESDPFTATINIIIAGDKLGVPAGSLNFHLRKRLNGCARKQLMPFTQVRDLYDVRSDMYDLNLRDIACSSVFNAWWDARLDESINPELMEELSDMRDDFKELDEDLHEACKAREAEIRKKWAEKRAKKEAEQTGDSNNNTAQDGGWDSKGAAASGAWDSTPAATGDWNSSTAGLTQAPTPASGDWENHNANSMVNDAFNDWARSEQVHNNAWSHDDSEIAAKKDWADEMNDPMPEPAQTIQIPQW